MVVFVVWPHHHSVSTNFMNEANTSDRLKLQTTTSQVNEILSHPSVALIQYDGRSINLLLCIFITRIFSLLLIDSIVVFHPEMSVCG